MHDARRHIILNVLSTSSQVMSDKRTASRSYIIPQDPLAEIPRNVIRQLYNQSCPRLVAFF